MSRRIHKGASLIAPWDQGELDSTCGIYAVVNALCILHALGKPLSRGECNILFREGIEAACGKQKGVAPVYEGMTVSRQMKVAKALFRSPTLRDRIPAVLREAVPRVKRGADLERAWERCQQRGDVLLVCFNGKIQHHTVIFGVTGERVLLFDSDGMKFVRRSTLRLAENPRGSLILRSLVPMGLDTSGSGASEKTSERKRGEK